MSRKSWIHKLSFNLVRRIGRRLALISAISLLLVVGMRESGATVGSQPAQTQDQDVLAAQVSLMRKMKEGEALRALGMPESLRLAAQKYEETLPLWRRIGDRRGEALTLASIGSVYQSLGERQKAIDFYARGLPLFRAVGASEEEARTLYEIGSLYQSLGENQKTLEFYKQLPPLYRAAGDRAGEGRMLYEIGNVYLSLGEKQKAVDSYAQALPIARAIGNRQAEAKILAAAGLAYKSLGKWRKAIDFYNQALPLARALGDRSGEAAISLDLGYSYDSLGEAPKALEFYNQALPLFRAVGDRRGEATALTDIGSVYNSLGEKQKALDIYNQALTIHRETGDRDGEAATIYSIGHYYNSLGEYKKALDFYNQALTLFRAVGDRRGEATTLTGVGSVYYSLGEKRKALDIYNQALTIHRETGDRRVEAATLGSIGVVYRSLGESQKALDFCNQALTLSRATGNRREEAAALGNIGLIYDSLGEYQKALDIYNQALTIHRETGDRSGEAATLNSVGYHYDSLGERQKALDFYNQAMTLSRAIGDRRVEAATLNNFGDLYRSLGEKRKAVDFYLQALTLSRAIGNRSGEAAALNNFGFVYDSLGEKQKALDFYNQALSLYRSVGDRDGEATTLGNIGAIYHALGEKQKALDFYNQALPIRRAIGDRRGEGITLNNIGDLYRLLGEYQKALDLYNRALTFHRAIGARDGEAVILTNIAVTKRDLGNFDESRSHVESALKIIESIRAEVVSKDLRASYLATAQSPYEFYINLLMRMRSREPAKGHDAEALQASERYHARSLIESLTEARVDIRRGADPKLLAQERSLQQRLNAKAEEALRVSASGADDTQLEARRQEIDALTIELQQVQTQIRQTSPRYLALTQPQPLTLAEIQRQALDADTLLLEYSLGEERSYLWAVTPATINSYELPRRDEIEAAAQRVYELLSKAHSQRAQAARPGVSASKKAGEEYLAAATSLSRILLGPVATQLGKKRLLIVADGMLHYIPFGALPDPNNLKESGGIWQPLLVDHEIVNMPSASTIAVLRSELAGRKPAAKTMAVLADPVFSRDDERVKRGPGSAEQRDAQRDPLDESRARILVQIGGGAPDDLRIKRLPFTRQEAEAIMALAPAGAGIKALDFEASRATATSNQLSQYRYLHFATHGLADSERPELSAIVLSLYDEQGRPQDGFLRAHEVYNLDLPAELVTLSACETGLGKLTRGEGLVSLTRGFMYAGAARVVVSLWSVSDRATAELMTKFYRRILAGGERPAAALRAAQVEMWRDKRWEAPYYWAAFTLQGEWR